MGSAPGASKGRLLGPRSRGTRVKETGPRSAHPVVRCPGPFPFCWHLSSSSYSPPLAPLSLFRRMVSVSSGVCSSQNSEIKGRSQAGPEVRVSLCSSLFSRIMEWLGRPGLSRRLVARPGRQDWGNVLWWVPDERTTVAYQDTRIPKYSLGTQVLPSPSPRHRNKPKGTLGLCPRAKK